MLKHHKNLKKTRFYRIIKRYRFILYWRKIVEIEQIIKVSQLYDFYSELLSQKQKQYLNDYFFNDLSLTEISENYEISKQAVSNNIKRTIIELEQFEEKLNLIKFKVGYYYELF